MQGYKFVLLPLMHADDARRTARKVSCHPVAMMGGREQGWDRAGQTRQ